MHRATFRRIPLDGIRLLLGVSGGSDSVALLAYPLYRDSPNRQVLVAHVRHGLRPGEGPDTAPIADASKELERSYRILEMPPADARVSRGEIAARRRRLAALTRIAPD